MCTERSRSSRASAKSLISSGKRTGALRQQHVEKGSFEANDRSTVRRMTLKALVLAIFAHLSPGADHTAEPAVVDAIVAAVGDESLEVTGKELALVVTYAWLESRAHLVPRPESGDSLNGTSCGMLQEPCVIVHRSSPTEQVRLWLRWEREAGLASVDSSARRASRREALAVQALQDAVADIR